MSDHPIEGLMSTAMESIKNMVDVNTIVGDAVEAPDGTVIIPISKVSFGFAAGGSEFGGILGSKSEDGHSQKLAFGGGSGAGVTIQPVAFMVVGQGQMKLMPVTTNSSLDKILEFVPELIEKINESVRKKVTIKKKAEKGEDAKVSSTEIENE